MGVAGFDGDVGFAENFRQSALLFDISPGGISTWTNDHPESVHQLRTFDETLRLDSLSVGRDGLLLVYATDPNSGGRGGAPIDLTFSSTDAGKSWDQATDKVAQGGYFDAHRPTRCTGCTHSR